MKKVSLILTFIIVYPIILFSQEIYSDYDDKGALKMFGVKEDMINSVAKPYIILLVIYIIAFLVSILLNIKKKYLANTIVVAAMMIALAALPLIFRLII